MYIFLVLVFLMFFFFKQKTAYEMRMSDWSSDVCSSDLKGNVAFMVRLVVFLAERRGEAVTTRQQADITQAVQQLTTLIDREARTLSTLNTLLPNPYSDDETTSTIHARLAPWCQGGEYGWVFDNPADELSLATGTGKPALCGFDLTELLADEAVRGAAPMYVHTSIESFTVEERLV